MNLKLSYKIILLIIIYSSIDCYCSPKKNSQFFSNTLAPQTIIKEKIFNKKLLIISKFFTSKSPKFLKKIKIKLLLSQLFFQDKKTKDFLDRIITPDLTDADFDIITFLKLLREMQKEGGKNFLIDKNDEYMFMSYIYLLAGNNRETFISHIKEIKKVHIQIIDDFKFKLNLDKTKKLINKWQNYETENKIVKKIILIFLGTITSNLDEKIKLDIAIDQNFPPLKDAPNYNDDQYFLNQVVGPGTERPVYNLDDLRDKKYISKAEAEPYIQKDKDELKIIADALSISSDEVLSKIIYQMKKIFILAYDALKNGDKIFEINGRKYSLHFVIRDGDLTLFFEDPFAKETLRVLRINRYSIMLNQRGIFYKGEPTSDIFIEYNKKHWDQVYPTSPLKFYLDHMIPLDSIDIPILKSKIEAVETSS